jgi:MFS family permease
VRPYIDLLRREQDFRRVYTAQLISLGGDWFAIVPLLNLLARETGSGVYGSLVLAADTLLIALVSPYAGSIADRYDRRTILIAADVVSAVVVLALLLVRGPATAWIGVSVIGAIAVAKAFYQPASSAALPNLVSRADLPTANVLVGASWGTMLAVGAALGGLADAAFGPYTCFVIDGASFLLSAWLTVLARRPFQQAGTARGGRPQVWRDLRETGRYVRGDRRVATLLSVKSGVGLGNGTLALFPLLATGAYAVGPLGTGLLFAARGLGALIGPLITRRSAADEARLYPVMAAGMLGFGLCYIAFGLTPWFWAALLLVVVAHMGGGANWVLSSYGLQATVPDALRGRVFSADFMLATLAMALGQLVAGWASELVDVRVLASTFGGVTLLYGVLWLAATRGVRRTAAASGPSAVPGESG